MTTIMGGLVIFALVRMMLIAIDAEKEVREMKDEYEREKLYKR